MTDIFHGTVVLFEGHGLLLIGPSGSGKSDLALRLIDAGGLLIGDDYVELRAENGILHASAAPNLAGKIEVRGLGLMTMPYCPSTPIHLVIHLIADQRAIERMPDAAFFSHANISIPQIDLWPHAASTIAKIKLALGNL
jgi:HPr kinase/phosphorylase